MRPILAALSALALATPAAAWQAGTDGALCPITLTAPAPWPEAGIFSIAFLGGAEITISTDRQTLSQGGLSLTVTDRGFGNVLAGLSGNTTALFRLGDTEYSASLAGAAPEVAAFEACGASPAV